jgi:putative transposase
VAEQHRRLGEHRKTLHGGLANRLLAHGAALACEKINYLAWQKNFPRSVRDRAPGLLVEVMRRKAVSAGGDRLYEFNTTTTALSQTCLCGNRKKKPLSQRVHRCGCGITEDRDLFSAYLGLHVHPGAQGCDRLDLQAANHGWLHRHDVDGRRGLAVAVPNRRGRRHPPSRRSVARIKARRQAKSRDATEPVGANFCYQPAHGVSRISNETAGWHRESPQFSAGRTSTLSSS